MDIYAPWTALTKYGWGANLYGTANEDDRDATLGFIDYFKLPLAGGRTPSDASIKSNWYGGDYWSSSPEEWGSFAGILRLFVGSYQYIVSAGSFSARANGYSLRCFRDAYIVPNLYYISFDTQGWSEISDKMAVENTPRKMPENPTKNNYIFAGWYTSTGYTDVFDFSTLATEDTIVYAKWEICPEWYEIVNNKCLFKTRWITYQNWIIKNL